MAIIENLYTGDGTTVLFPFSFSYLDRPDVKVTVNSTLTTDFTFANDSTVEFNTAPANGAFIRIFRETPIDQAKATFFAGSAIRASDLNQNNTQLVFSAQEVLNRAVNKLGDVMAGILNMGGFKITNLGAPTNAGDAVTKAFVDAAVAAGISDGDKGDITVSGSGGTWTVNDGSITSSKILDGTIVDVDVSASAALAYSKLALAGSVVDADVNASAAIAGTKISPDFGSQNVVTTGTVTAGSFPGPVIDGTILEEVFTITDGADFEVDPGNGSIQLITLGANRTPKATNFDAGESITLMVDDGTAHTLTWTDTTWGTAGVNWTGGSAPTLATTGYTTIQFWKVGTQVYGAFVGVVA